MDIRRRSTSTGGSPLVDVLTSENRSSHSRSRGEADPLEAARAGPPPPRGARGYIQGLADHAQCRPGGRETLARPAVHQERVRELLLGKTMDVSGQRGELRAILCAWPSCHTEGNEQQIAADSASPSPRLRNCLRAAAYSQREEEVRNLLASNRTRRELARSVVHRASCLPTRDDPTLAR